VENITRIDSPSSAIIQLSDELCLVRYMPFPKFLSIVGGQFPFTPLRLLGQDNDPLESHPITAPQVIMKELSDLSNKEELLKEIGSSAPRWMQDALSDASATDGNRANVYARAFHGFIRERRAVSCWFANGFESAAMWTGFAPQGVAVETTLGGIEKMLPAGRNFLVSAVRYRNRGRFKIGHANMEKFPNMVLRPFLLKGQEFEHEKEVRIITRCHSEQKWFSVPVPDFYKCIRRVIISPYIDPVSASALKQHIEEHLARRFGENDTPPVCFSTINSPVLEGSESEAALDKLYDEYMPADDQLPL